MKVSIVAGILLVLLVALVVGNAFYLKNTASRMENMLIALPPRPEEDAPQKVRELQVYTKWHKPYLALSVNFSALDRVTELCENLRIYAEIGDVMNYQITKATLLDAVDDMGRLEKVMKG